MPARMEPQSEPIPGYRLLEHLGEGGFGEVWKAEAPGGIHKAVKIVFGKIPGGKGTDEDKADRELKGLSRIRDVRHPFILSMDRYEIDNEARHRYGVGGTGPCRPRMREVPGTRSPRHSRVPNCSSYCSRPQRPSI
ncbi:MAG: hypothetical protein U1D30_01420 [Planctomycetota bacterium]